MKIIFDSSILIDHLRGLLKAKGVVKKVENRKVEGIISAITEAEVFSGKDCENTQKRYIVEALIKSFVKFDVDNDIAQKAAEFRRKYNVPLIDCIVAATAFNYKAKLWTKNTEHFKKIKEVESEEPY